MKRKISALAAVLLAIGLTACGNNNSQVSADATQNMQIESSVETENTNNTEEVSSTISSVAFEASSLVTVCSVSSVLFVFSVSTELSICIF